MNHIFQNTLFYLIVFAGAFKLLVVLTGCAVDTNPNERIKGLESENLSLKEQMHVSNKDLEQCRNYYRTQERPVSR